MASKSTGWKCAHTASVISQTNTTATIRVTGYWENLGWSYDINYVTVWVYCNGKSYKIKNNGSVDAPNSYTKYSMGYHDFTIDKTTAKQSVSCYAKITSNSSYVSGTKTSTSSSVSVSAKPSYTVTYNANGGSGAPGTQTKWHGSNLTLSSTKPTRTGYTFLKWNTNSSGTGTSYNPGVSYTSNSALKLYAIWNANTYTVAYNANGGTGVPSNQIKTYGVDLTLSSTEPTRSNYNFLGWSTSTNGGVNYSSGATYKNNSAVTLYAVWELAYVKPRINNFEAQRCNSEGTPDDEGTYVKVTFDWATDKEINAIKIEWKSQEADIWTDSEITAAGTSGTVDQIVGSGDIDNETSYLFRAFVTDTGTDDGTTYSPQLIISTPKFPIDVKAEGKGISFGKAAELDDTADFAFKVKLGAGLVPIFLEAETDLDDVRTPNFYTGENVASFNYSNCPISSGTFYLEVVSCGENGQVRQTITNCSKIRPTTYVRFYYQEAWGPWRSDWDVLDNGTDFNTLMLANNYIISSYKTYTNAPEDTIGGTLEVLGNEYLVQRFTVLSKTNPRTYERSYYGDAWGEWICVSRFGGKVLWSGGYYMTSSHSANLSEAISKQPHGIVLVFSEYSGGTIHDYTFSHHFFSKELISLHEGSGHVVFLTNNTFNAVGMKYLYIYDTKITGHENNNKTGTADSGITYANNRYVLRYVIGV